MPRLGYFGSKSINFIIFAKFCMCSISNVVISNLTLVFENFQPKSPNMGILGSKNIDFLIVTKFCLYPISKVLISNLTSGFCGSQQPSTQVTRTNTMFPFCNLFGKPFSFFRKILKILWSRLLFFEGAYCKYEKKSKHILSLIILSFKK